jgi:hypothetical protein
MPRALAAALLLLGAACQPLYIGMSPLDSLEARLSLTPAQRPAWQVFRKEAQRAQARWSAPDAPGRAELRAALSGPAFDRNLAQQAAALAARQGTEDAQRLIEAWSRVDAQLSEAQRQEVRRCPPF